MPLARIQCVVDSSPAAASGEIAAYWSQVEADTASRRDIVTALIEQWRSEGAMSTETGQLRMEVGSSCRRGRRETQQDALLTGPELVAVADGFGAQDGVAAIALDGFARGGIDVAMASVSDALPSSGTTLTAIRLEGQAARISHVGDARVWLVRDGSCRQLTHDHTVVAALIEAGELTVEEARSHAHRSLLNRALTPGVAVDELLVEVVAGDRLVLTTDGVHAVLDDVAGRLLGGGSPHEVASAVAAAVVDAGEPDNHTVVVADVMSQDIGDSSASRHR